MDTTFRRLGRGARGFFLTRPVEFVNGRYLADDVMLEETRRSVHLSRSWSMQYVVFPEGSCLVVLLTNARVARTEHSGPDGWVSYADTMVSDGLVTHEHCPPYAGHIQVTVT